MCIMYVYTHFFQHSKLLRKMPQLINLIFIEILRVVEIGNSSVRWPTKAKQWLSYGLHWLQVSESSMSLVSMSNCWLCVSPVISSACVTMKQTRGWSQRHGVKFQPHNMLAWRSRVGCWITKHQFPQTYNMMMPKS